MHKLIILRVSSMILLVLGSIFLIYHLYQPTPLQSTQARIVRHEKSRFTNHTILKQQGTYYQVPSILAPTGSIVALQSVSTKKVFSFNDPFERYQLGRGIYSQNTIEYEKTYSCDIICFFYQSRETLIRWMDMQWKHHTCNTHPLCGDIQTLAQSLVIGGKGDFSQSTKDLLIHNSLYHIVVVSGFQIGILFFILEKLFLQSKIAIVPRILGIVLLLIFYGFITGFEPPILRSLAHILLAFGVLLFFGRGMHSWLGILYSTLFLLILFPYLSFSLSLHLSLAAVCGVIAWGHIHQLYTSLPWYVQVGAVSCITTLTTLPLTAQFGNAMSLGSVLANIVILPAIPLLTLLSLLSVIPAIGIFFGACFTFFGTLIFTFLSWLDTAFLSSSITFSSFNRLDTILWYAILFLLYWGCIGFLTHKKHLLTNLEQSASL